VRARAVLFVGGTPTLPIAIPGDSAYMLAGVCCGAGWCLR
jgi:hypothetical protein